MMHDTETRKARKPWAHPEFADQLGFWLAAYCPRCVASGQCWRPDTLANAHTITWGGGTTIRTEHMCECGHAWAIEQPARDLFGPE